jgi:uncharacterized protein (TIGR03083 family)
VETATKTGWERAQDALRDEVRRVTALLRAVPDPAAPAVGSWNLAETAMHLSQVWLVAPGLAKADLSGIYEVIPNLEGTAGDSLIRDIWELDGVTRLGVRSDPERDPGVIVDRIEARAQAYFEGCAGRSAEQRRPWLVEGSSVSLATLTGHLLNETVVHGHDIARAAGRRWPIEPSTAATVLADFVILDPRALVSEHAAGARAVFDLRIRGGSRFRFVFDDGAMRIEEPSSRGTDCHISADPVALLMLVCGRRSQWTAIGTGQLTAWGRKPWLGPRFRAFLRNP